MSITFMSIQKTNRIFQMSLPKGFFHKLKMLSIFISILLVRDSISVLYAQTDETIFREFQFDFSNPGARANGMGRAFVGLSDEATAAYNNPAGLSILAAPEFTFEYRNAHSSFDSLQPKPGFSLDSGELNTTRIDLNDFTFASYSQTWHDWVISAFYVNHLSYKRPKTSDTTYWLRDTAEEFYVFKYINESEAKGITISSTGLSFSRKFGSWSFGLSLGMAKLDLEYSYISSLSADEIALTDIVSSHAKHRSAKPTFVFGCVKEVSSHFKLALSLKFQPIFNYKEFATTNEFDTEKSINVQFKVPDSYQLGFSYQPNDYWTFVGEIDYVLYSQLSGDNMTILSSIRVGFPDDYFSFQKSDYQNKQGPEFHLGTEYLFPLGKQIFALRAGVFTERDHKTRFIGKPPEDLPENSGIRNAYTVQDFIFNVGDDRASIGTTFGLGYVHNNRIQFDAAIVKSSRIRWMVTSLLYRF